MDIKTKSSNQLGDYRREILQSVNDIMRAAVEEANRSGSLRLFKSVEVQFKSLEATLEAGSDAKKDWLRGIEDIENEKKRRWAEYMNIREKIGFFERNDIEKQMPIDIEVNALQEKEALAWKLVKDRGIFNA